MSRGSGRHRAIPCACDRDQDASRQCPGCQAKICVDCRENECVLCKRKFRSTRSTPSNPPPPPRKSETQENVNNDTGQEHAISGTNRSNSAKKKKRQQQPDIPGYDNSDELISEIITSLEKPGYVAGLWRAQSDRVRRDVVRQVPQNEELRRAVSPFIPTTHARKCKDRPGVAQGCHQYDWAYYFQVRLLGLGMISRFWSKIL
jgi:hypothetical protein